MPPQQAQQPSNSGGGLDSLVADPQFQSLQPSDQRKALSGVSGDDAFGKLNDEDTGKYVKAHQAILSQNTTNNTLQKTSGISAQPKPFTLPWLKQGAWRAAASTADAMPAIGGTVGSMIGATAGGGAASVPGAIGGAGMGGAGGAAAQQIMRRLLGFPDVPQTSGAAAQDITKQGATQAAIQGATEVLPFAAGKLKNAAEGQYERALSPTTKINKAITKKIVPELIQRGEAGSLEGMGNSAADKIDELNPALDRAYAAATAQHARPKIKGLLNAAPTSIPLGPPPQPGEMPIGVFPAEQYPRSSVSSGEPPARLAQELGPAANTIPARIYRPAYKSTTEFGNVLGDVEQPTTGVMQSRDPNVINQVYPQTGKPYPWMPDSSVKGAGTKILSDLENLKGEYTVDGSPASPQAVNAISGVQNIVKQFGSDISPNSLRKLKSIFDDPVAQRGGYAGADLATAYTLKAQKAAADSIRGIMSQASPDVAALNKEISFWLNVQKVTSESGLRKTGQEGGLMKVLTPMAAALAGGGGAAAGGAQVGIEAGVLTALTGYAAQAIRSPTWRTASAVLKDRFANALARGDVKAVTGLLGRFGVAAAGSQTSTQQPTPAPQQQ
jgi:hypothetical protein